jgi:calcium-dependent protein kinase
MPLSHSKPSNTSQTAENTSAPPEPTAFDQRTPFGADAEVHRLYSFSDTEVGSGAFGSVRVATHKLSHIKYAIKTIRKDDIDPSKLVELNREVEVMFHLDHPNIVRLVDVYQDERFLHLVEECCDGGELFDRIVECGHFSEESAKVLVYELLCAITHCHAKGIVHRGTDSLL